MHDRNFLSVTQLSKRIKNALENNQTFNNVKIHGEVSNLTYHPTGHVYLSLKDEESQLSAIIFKSVALSAPKLTNGDKVKVTATLQVYTQRGILQLNITKVEKIGQGELYQQYLSLKHKFEKQGLFSQDRKRRLPSFPKHIAVLTAPTGAVIRDIYQTIKNRYPLVIITLFPVRVQGSLAVTDLLRTLDFIKNSDVYRPDVVIIARGGGSFEELSVFNEEALILALANFPYPTVSAVGHETDFTLCDFVADVRAATPTAAAVLTTPDITHLVNELAGLKHNLINIIQRKVADEALLLENYKKELTYYNRNKHQSMFNHINIIKNSLYALIQKKHLIERSNIAKISSELRSLMQNRIYQEKILLGTIKQNLEQFDYKTIYEKGYTYTTINGVNLNKYKGQLSGHKIKTFFSNGEIESIVQ